MTQLYLDLFLLLPRTSTYLLTPWRRVLLEKLTGSAASQEIPCISQNPKVHYHTHKRLPPAFILGQPNPVHIPTSNLLEIRSNIIRPSTPRSPQWSPSLRFPLLDPRHPLSSPIRATCPAHLEFPVLLAASDHVCCGNVTLCWAHWRGGAGVLWTRYREITFLDQVTDCQLASQERIVHALFQASVPKEM